ncbi:MAG: hypothetical protein SFU56_05645 [Capsulimonadales bacterium]|nr:hypothetical protein [Capsulimonadales bacterium]
MDHGTIALFIPIVALFIPISAIWTHHLRQMAEIKAQQGKTIAPDVRQDLNEIKQQLSELRDTTTRFDMSFDAAITTLERRMDNFEQAQGQIPPLPHRVTVAGAEETPVVLQKGGR